MRGFLITGEESYLEPYLLGMPRMQTELDALTRLVSDNPQQVARALGHGLTVIVEITLDRQDADALLAFEKRVAHDDAVQQCYQVSPGPDFVLIVHARHMPDYQALTKRLFTSDANVRNVKAFFSVKRSKFGANLPLSPLAAPA
jgi:DNA-binding Lrp family transcriptional regulator